MAENLLVSCNWFCNGREILTFPGRFYTPTNCDKLSDPISFASRYTYGFLTILIHLFINGLFWMARFMQFYRAPEAGQGTTTDV